MGKDVDKATLNKLYEAVLTLETPEECRKFFQDVCTINEENSMAQRFEVAWLLEEGKTYVEVEQLTGASSATISRVNKALNYGSDGYRTVIDRMKKK